MFGPKEISVVADRARLLGLASLNEAEAPPLVETIPPPPPVADASRRWFVRGLAAAGIPALLLGTVLAVVRGDAHAEPGTAASAAPIALVVEKRPEPEAPPSPTPVASALPPEGVPAPVAEVPSKATKQGAASSKRKVPAVRTLRAPFKPGIDRQGPPAR